GKKIFVCWIATLPVICAAAFIPENQRRIPTVSIHVPPRGDDAGDGSASRPFRTLVRAQRAVGAANSNADVVVELADGIYRLDEPLN
ncbi:MAG: right-handed parallel beta-helix repeat-containing protein, partial [Pseudomonadota bacterium]